MTVFGLLFSSYLVYRAEDVEAFMASQNLLHQRYGAVNLVLLLCSSWLVALALRAVRYRQQDLGRWLYSVALFCAFCFAVIKLLEWGALTEAGHGLAANSFFTFYYMLTGIHFLHVIIGIGVLVFLRNKCRPSPGSNLNISVFEGGNVYWHMVDLLWIVLFPLLYLVR